ncbi:hypothetical protein [Flammeovirga aprica]|uniref:DUF5017 domain-containing protein n=1 Tax=Flammeovirga aprica JL-4 TaxID=694437 RepID=A0A7X9X9T0_9BACT|nr:hypothetical protein [Flammeovirga aprica]NME69072.1 hypothetical protein [Flammeovirga aprica JL-4]
MRLKYLIQLLMVAFLFSCGEETSIDPDQDMDNVGGETEGTDNQNGDGEPEVQLGYNYLNTTDITYTSENSTYFFTGLVSVSDVNVKADEKLYSFGALKFKYQLSSFFGEPTRAGIFLWSDNNGENEINTIKLRFKLFNTDGTFTGVYYVYSPLVDNDDNEWSFDVTGSPDWDEFFHANEELSAFISAEAAKDLYKAEFYLGEMDIIEINGKEVTLD